MSEERFTEQERDMLNAMCLQQLSLLVSPERSPGAFELVNGIYKKLSGTDKVVIVRNG